MASGFGIEVREALDRRVDELVRQGHGDGAAATNQSYRDPSAAGSGAGRPRASRPTGSCLRACCSGPDRARQAYGVDAMASGRFAMIDNGLGFSLVPWRPVLENKIGRKVMGEMRGEDVSWQFGCPAILAQRQRPKGSSRRSGNLGLIARMAGSIRLIPKPLALGCPTGQPSACVQALATHDTFPNVRLLDYPPERGSASGLALKKFDISFTSVPGGSEGALVAALQAAVAGHKPLLMRFWSPHWVLAQMPVEWLKMPPCDPNDLKACIIAPPVIKFVCRASSRNGRLASH